MDDSDKGTQLGTAQPEKDTGKAGFVRQLTEIVVEKVDAAVESPNNRALRIHEILRNSIDSTGRTPNDWDMICFSVEFLGLMSHTYPWLEQVAKEASKLVYTAHYHGYFSEDNETIKRDTESGRKVFL
jgi:hypothetical protein